MKALRNIVCLLALGLILAACAEPRYEKICEENGVSRACSAKESAMIDDMHFIIRSIRNYEHSHPDETMWLVREKSHYGKVRIKFFGERHNEIIGMIQTLATINAEIGHKDILLLEGADRRHSVFKCGVEQIFRIFWTLQWEKTGRSYSDLSHWSKNPEYVKMFETTRKSYDLTGLAIGDMHCGYWDDDKARAASVTANNIKSFLTPRNESMVEAIKSRLPDYNTVYVNAGLNHLPGGQAYLLIRNNYETFNKTPLPKKMSEFYRLVEDELRKPPTSRSLAVDEGSASTKVIYEYLKKERIGFTERTHGKMLN